jgi:hypothetical protein
VRAVTQETVLKLVTLVLLVTGVMQTRIAGATPVTNAPGPSQESSEFSLNFSAPAECPQRQEFEVAVMARTPAARLRDAGTGVLALSVTLAADASAFAGVLGITLPDGARSERTVEATSCREASLSLAVIASLVLEAYREHRTLPTAATDDASSAAAPSGQAVNEPSPAPASPTAPAPPAQQSAPVPPARPAAPVPTEQPPPATRLLLGLFGALGLETAVAETPPFAAMAGVHLERRARRGWSPSVRLGGVITANGRSRGTAGSAEFRLLAARLALCPWRFAATSSLSLTPCVELDAGSLRGGESNAPNATVRYMPWLGLGAGGRGEWAFGKLLSLDAFAGVRVLTRHDHFVLVTPNNPARSALLYDVPAWSAGVGLGATFRLPL